jgi:trehalose 6-phosphate phosphatase
MRYFFGPGYEPRLRTLFAGQPLFAFDFDGTLAPLVEQPARARPRPVTERMLTELARAHPVVIISGRARADVERRLGALPHSGVTGNHGLEPWGESPALERLVVEWRQALEPELRRMPGVLIEDKRWSLTIDYRHAPDLEGTATRLHALAHRLPGARLLGGRHADFNIAPAGEVNKGTALTKYMERFGCNGALYVGDDRTDEDAFAAPVNGLISVRIGRRRQSRAGFFLRDQNEMDRLLGALLPFLPQRAERRR